MLYRPEKSGFPSAVRGMPLAAGACAAKGRAARVASAIMIGNECFLISTNPFKHIPSVSGWRQQIAQQAEQRFDNLARKKTMASSAAATAKQKIASDSLHHAIRLLDIVGKTDGGLTNAGISRALDLATSSCSYVLGELERAGYVSRNPQTRRYQLGLKLVTLAEGALREIGYRRIAEPALHKLVAGTGLTANICVLEANNVVLVDRVESPAFIRPEV